LVGAIIGPMAMATIFDRTGSYDLGLMLLPVLPFVALLLLWRVPPLPVSA
jgi:MFS-type transporter involved in bile tolerance (Atg22 family)